MTNLGNNLLSHVRQRTRRFPPNAQVRINLCIQSLITVFVVISTWPFKLEISDSSLKLKINIGVGTGGGGGGEEEGGARSPSNFRRGPTYPLRPILPPPPKQSTHIFLQCLRETVKTRSQIYQFKDFANSILFNSILNFAIWSVLLWEMSLFGTEWRREVVGGGELFDQLTSCEKFGSPLPPPPTNILNLAPPPPHPHQCSQPCPLPPPPPIMQNLPTPMIKSHQAACSCKIWIVKQDVYVHDHTAYIHTYLCRYYRRKQHTLRNQP